LTDAHIETEEEEDDPTLGAECEKARQYFEQVLQALGADLVESHMVLSPPGDQTETGVFDEHLMDDHYSRTLLAQIPKMVRRTLRLGRVSGRSPAGTVNVYLREAARAYVMGLHQATVALARSALEQALRECIRLPGAEGWLLDRLLEGADKCKVLEPASLQSAKRVQRVGNAVIHGGPCDENAAFSVLSSARTVLEVLYN
jgi:hypothetical protein